MPGRQYLLQALPSALEVLNVYSEAEREGCVAVTVGRLDLTDGGGPVGGRANARGGSNPSSSACVYPRLKPPCCLYSPSCRQG